MRTSAEVKFTLEERLLALAGDGGPVPVITGIHSIVVTGEEVSVIFDIMPDTTGNGLHFEFEMAMITREELCRFGEWLAESSYGGTVH